MPSPNAIAHLLAIATFILIVLVTFGMGRSAHASAPNRMSCGSCRGLSAVHIDHHTNQGR
jgi:hypothetical protein